MFKIFLLRFGERQITNDKFYAPKSLVKIWGFNVDNIVLSKLVKRKTNYKYFITYLDKTIRQLVLLMPKISRYVETFKVKKWR